MVQPDIRAMIDAAVAAGRVTFLPEGTTAHPPRNPASTPEPKFHPHLCGRGRQIGRERHLDEIDRDRA